MAHSSHRHRLLVGLLAPGLVATVLAASAGGAPAVPAATSGSDRGTALPGVFRPVTQLAAGAQVENLRDPGPGGRIGAGEYRGGAFRDPAEKVVDSRDVRTVDLYTRRKTGYVSGVVGFEAAPTARDSAVAVYTGAVVDGACQVRQVLAAPTKGGAGIWATTGADGSTTAQGDTRVRSTRVGRRVLVEATVPAFRAGTFGCGFVASSSLDGTPVFDRSDYVRFGETDPLFEQYYGSRFGDVESTPPHVGAVVGRRQNLRISIRNNPDIITTVSARNVQVGLAGRGVAIARPVVDLGTLEFYDDKPATFAVRLKKRRTTTLRWTALGDYGAANGTITVHPLGKPLTIGRNLAGRRFWAPTNLSFQRKGVWFVNRRFAYVGFPKGGQPRCTKVTSNGSKPGCVRYSYDAGKDRLTIAGKRAKVGERGFAWKGYSFRALAIPKAGARWQTAVTHTNSTTSGTLEYLDLYFRLDGTFSSNRSVFARVPEGRGRYAVQKDGQLRLTYSGGKVVRTNIGVLTDQDGRPDPWQAGLFVGNAEYTWD